MILTMENRKEYFLAETKEIEYYQDKDQNLVMYRKKDHKKSCLGKKSPSLKNDVLSGNIIKISPVFINDFQDILKDENLLLIPTRDNAV